MLIQTVSNAYGSWRRVAIISDRPTLTLSMGSPFIDPLVSIKIYTGKCLILNKLYSISGTNYFVPLYFISLHNNVYFWRWRRQLAHRCNITVSILNFLATSTDTCTYPFKKCLNRCAIGCIKLNNIFSNLL